MEYIDRPNRIVSPDESSPQAERDGNPLTDSGPFSFEAPRTSLSTRDRLFSDILIANSTLPGIAMYQLTVK